MKFSFKFKRKSSSLLYTKRRFAVPTMGLVRAEIVYLPQEVDDDNDVLYLIMNQIKKNYNIQLLPDQIQLLN